MAKKETRKTTGAGGKRGQPKAGARGEISPGAGGPPAGEAPETGGAATATLAIPHEQIAERARLIWEQRGRPQGEDERNWKEAERQLKEEMGIE